ncbi:MAG TPA: DUF1906 domain-containing protein [Longimicrobium sp.]|nr:DUF1906 domain-containing protein [Longimicrobium sp.]
MAINEAEVPGGPPILAGTVSAATPGMKGFDANVTITAGVARAFVQAGYKFCIRYVGRTQMASHDLTASEAKDILNAGLALMVVQHVLNPGWEPTGDLGNEYGTNAGRFSKQAGLPSGVTVWCDLEGVSGDAAAQNVIDYCNQWYAQVKEAGYVPGLYVGYGTGLTAQQLYQKLRFQNYWRAYNLNDDQVPVGRGVQMTQKTGKGTVGGLTTEVYDDDFTHTDALGGNAIWLAPPGI